MNDHVMGLRRMTVRMQFDQSLIANTSFVCHSTTLSLEFGWHANKQPPAPQQICSGQATDVCQGVAPTLPSMWSAEALTK